MNYKILFSLLEFIIIISAQNINSSNIDLQNEVPDSPLTKNEEILNLDIIDNDFHNVSEKHVDISENKSKSEENITERFSPTDSAVMHIHSNKSNNLNVKDKKLIIDNSKNEDSIGNTHSSDNSKTISEDVNNEERYIDSNSSVDLRGIDLRIIEIGIRKMINPRCRNQSLEVLNGIKEKNIGALKMFQASTKFPEGLLNGAKYFMGNFDECLSTISFSQTIKPQYCLVDIMLSRSNQEDINQELTSIILEGSNSSMLHWAICLPSVCASEDIEFFLQEVINKELWFTKGLEINITSKNSQCQQEQEFKLDAIDICYGVAIGVFMFILISATGYHIVKYIKGDSKEKSHVLSQTIMSFSIIGNLQKLGSKGSSDLGLECIGGMKALAMMFIITGHSLIFLVTGPVTNSDFFLQARTEIQNAFLLNSPLLVDTFLLISGFLMCRLLLLELEKRNGSVNVLALYVFRYIRLTPAYFVVVGLYSTWLVHLDSGPLWRQTIEQEKLRCRESWWTNILYVNNYVNNDKLCMFQSWYLAADTQLFMLAPIFIYPLYKWRRFGEWLLGFVTVVAMIIPFAVTIVYKLEPTLLLLSTDSPDLSSHDYYKDTYIKTHMRASSYCFGLIFGYAVHRMQAARYSLPGRTRFICWIVATICGIGSMFSVTIFYIPGYKYSTFEAALYSSMHRVTWCLGTGWLILVSVTGNGGFLSRLMRWKALIPLSRLTYCAYLVNGLIELHALGTVRQPRYISIYTLLCDSLAHVCLTFVGALILCLIFESPIHSLEKILLRLVLKPQERPKTSTERLQVT